MPRFFISAFIVFSFSSSLAQSGTLIIAGIINNGVIIAADTRGMFYESGDHKMAPIAYVDSSCKIFKLKQFILGIAGSFGAGEEYYSTIVEAFNKTSFYDTGLLNTIRGFVDYVDKKYPPDVFPERKINTFIGGGYVNNKPEIAALIYPNGEKVQYNGVIFSDTNVLKYAILVNLLGLSVNDKLEKTIRDYAIGEKKTLTIGGPISIIKIYPKGGTLPHPPL